MNILRKYHRNIKCIDKKILIVLMENNEDINGNLLYSIQSL